MYKVIKLHHKPFYRNGDLEDTTEIVDTKVFKTRKGAKDFIEKELCGKSNPYRSYHKGNEISICQYHTGKTWVHENTGETCHEFFIYKMFKADYDK